jgi:uncharacterized protein
MIALEPHAEGVILPVKAHAGARRNAIEGVHDGSLRISVTQAPEKGKANKAIAELLAKALKLRKSQVELISGEASQQKKFLVRGVTAAELNARIEEISAS